MGFARHVDIDIATTPTRLQRARRAALEVATSPIPSLALAALLVRTIKRPAPITRRATRPSRDVAVAGPALA